MRSLTRGLMWPVLTLLVIGGTHFLAEALRPELREAVTTPVVMPIYLVAGAWAAVLTRREGGNYVLGLVAGAILGLLPLMLQVIGFGLLLGRDGAAALTSGVFGLLAIFWGGALSAGIGEIRWASGAAS